MLTKETERETYERRQKICAGCNNSKDQGLVVCWSCFKAGKYPYKHFTGTLEEWLILIRLNKQNHNNAIEYNNDSVSSF